jgi:Nickel responsive protein SCO4226-like
MPEAELREAALRSLEVLRQLGPEIQWIHSYVADDKIYCIYFTRDESLILEHSKLYGSLARIDRIQAVRWMLDPINYVQKMPDAPVSSAHSG